MFCNSATPMFLKRSDRCEALQCMQAIDFRDFEKILISHPFATRRSWRRKAASQVAGAEVGGAMRMPSHARTGNILLNLRLHTVGSQLMFKRARPGLLGAIK